jgi:hypothetical protein
MDRVCKCAFVSSLFRQVERFAAQGLTPLRFIRPVERRREAAEESGAEGAVGSAVGGECFFEEGYELVVVEGGFDREEAWRYCEGCSG